MYQIIFERKLLKNEWKIHNILAYVLNVFHLNRCIEEKEIKFKYNIIINIT